MDESYELGGESILANENYNTEANKEQQDEVVLRMQLIDGSSDNSSFLVRTPTG